MVILGIAVIDSSVLDVEAALYFCSYAMRKVVCVCVCVCSQKRAHSADTSSSSSSSSRSSSSSSNSRMEQRRKTTTLVTPMRSSCLRDYPSLRIIVAMFAEETNRSSGGCFFGFSLIQYVNQFGIQGSRFRMPRKRFPEHLEA